MWVKGQLCENNKRALSCAENPKIFIDFYVQADVRETMLSLPLSIGPNQSNNKDNVPHTWSITSHTPISSRKNLPQHPSPAHETTQLPRPKYTKWRDCYRNFHIAEGLLSKVPFPVDSSVQAYIYIYMYEQNLSATSPYNHGFQPLQTVLSDSLPLFIITVCFISAFDQGWGEECWGISTHL